MKIQDFADMEKFESIMSDWAKATGLATVAVGADGKYISGCYNFTDFCIKLTRGSKEGCRRCEKCDGLCPCTHDSEDYEGKDLHCPCTDYKIKNVCECGLYVLDENYFKDKK